MPLNALFSYHTRESRGRLFNPLHPEWRKGDQAVIDRFWNGKSALREKGYHWNNLTWVGSLWNGDSLFFCFQCWYDRLNVNPGWDTSRPVHGLWERDVVEVFLQPKSCQDYFEIEVSPLAQRLEAHIRKPRSDVDFDWSSGLQMRVQISEEECLWRVFLALPFQSILATAGLERAPEAGDAWRLNLYRVAGEEPEREHLAWRPSYTPTPDFHVPTAFGNLIFLDR